MNQVPISGPVVTDDTSSNLHLGTKKRRIRKKSTRVNWDDYKDKEIVESEELTEMLFADPRSETDRTKDLKAQVGIQCVKRGEVFLQSGELPSLAASAISQLVTKKGHLLGVGKKQGMGAIRGKHRRHQDDQFST